MKAAVKCEGEASASPAVQSEFESVRRGEQAKRESFALRCGCTLNVQIRHACCCCCCCFAVEILEKFI